MARDLLFKTLANDPATATLILENPDVAESFLGIFDIIRMASKRAGKKYSQVQVSRIQKAVDEPKAKPGEFAFKVGWAK